MDDYTPNTEAVREQYTREQPPQIGTVSEKGEEFDRWLSAELAAAKAEAWDKGEEDGQHNAHEAWVNRKTNPYRADQIERTTDDH